MNGHIIRFNPQIQKLDSDYIQSKWIVSCESAAEEVSCEWLPKGKRRPIVSVMDYVMALNRSLNETPFKYVQKRLFCSTWL